MIGGRSSGCWPCTCLFLFCCLIPDIILGVVYYYANRALQDHDFSYYANQALQNRNISLSDYFGNGGSWKDLVDDSIIAEYADKFSNGDDDGTGIGSYISQYLAGNGGSWKDLVDDAIIAEYADKFSNGDDDTIASYISHYFTDYTEGDAGGDERYLRLGGYWKKR
jgi:hypothetical protein